MNSLQSSLGMILPLTSLWRVILKVNLIAMITLSATHAARAQGEATKEHARKPSQSP
jgi:hypothetical protein